VGQPLRLIGRPRLTVVAGWSAAVGYGVLASFTTPFTVGADVITALPLVAAVMVAVWWRRRPGRSIAVVTGEKGGPGWSRWSFVWAVPLLAVTAWELYCYSQLPRNEHPTLSALIDMLDANRVGKIVAVALWLALGFFLVAS
jgi:hypothetical protein